MTKSKADNYNTMAETLEQAIELLGGKLSFNFKSAEIERTVQLYELPAETIASLLDYGTRKLNDKVNSIFAMPSNELSRAQIVERVMAEAFEGKLGERRVASGGQVGLRGYILSFLRAQGVSSKLLEPYKGATPQAIVNAIYGKKDDATREAILAELTKRYEESLKALTDSGLDLAL